MPSLTQAITAFAISRYSILNNLNLVVTSTIILILVPLEILRVRKDRPFGRWTAVINRIIIGLLVLFAILILVKGAILYVLAGQLQAAQ
jgi:hypothetical protein